MPRYSITFTCTELVEASEASKPVGLGFSGVRTAAVDGGEHGGDERAVPREVVVRPGHELLTDLDARRLEVRGPD